MPVGTVRLALTCHSSPRAKLYHPAFCCIQWSLIIHLRSVLGHTHHREQNPQVLEPLI